MHNRLSYVFSSIIHFIGDACMRPSKREIIIDTARKLFAKYGFAKTTIDDISRDAITAKSTIYTYFSSKEELFQEIIAEEGRILWNEIQKSIDPLSRPDDKMRAYAKTRMKLIKQLHNLYNALTDEYLTHYTFIENARKSSLEREIREVSNILTAGVEDGTFKIKNIELTAFAIITAWKGMDFPWTDYINGHDPTENVDFLIDVLFDGIKQ